LDPYLKAILTRSAAELEMLVELVGPAAGTRYRGIMRAVTRPGLFFRRWPYVDSVELSADRVITIRMSREYPAAGSYRYRFDAVDTDTSTRYHSEGEYDYTRRETLRIRMPAEVRNLEVELRLDGCMAFKGRRSVGVVL
jgi:hypothetical protein